MSAHTPGPWFVTVHEIHTDVDSEYFTIAGDVSNDNASLIAAAPDLLTALTEILDGYWPIDNLAAPPQFIKDARAAIAKATGAA